MAWDRAVAKVSPIPGAGSRVRPKLLPESPLDWSDALFQVIDLRSFSSVWYWIVVAVTWSSVSHWVLGVPFDQIARARRTGGQAEEDLRMLLAINIRRMLHIAQTAGLVMTGFIFFAVTSLALLGFWYGMELAQAVFLLALPLAIVGAVVISTCRKLAADFPEGDALFKVLIRHRIVTQAIGMAAIFFTAMYGMYQNLDVVRGL